MSGRVFEFRLAPIERLQPIEGEWRPQIDPSTTRSAIVCCPQGHRVHVERVNVRGDGVVAPGAICCVARAKLKDWA